jgi:hypothetical protein
MGSGLAVCTGLHSRCCLLVFLSGGPGGSAAGSHRCGPGFAGASPSGSAKSGSGANSPKEVPWGPFFGSDRRALFAPDLAEPERLAQRSPDAEPPGPPWRRGYCAVVIKHGMKQCFEHVGPSHERPSEAMPLADEIMPWAHGAMSRANGTWSPPMMQSGAKSDHGPDRTTVLTRIARF